MAIQDVSNHYYYKQCHNKQPYKYIMSHIQVYI